MENLKEKIKQMGFRTSQALKGKVSVPKSEPAQNESAVSIMYEYEREIFDKITDLESELTINEEKRTTSGDNLDSMSRSIPSNFNYSPLFFVLTILLTFGMMIFAYAFYCSAFFNAFILDVADLQELNSQTMGNVFSIFNKMAFQKINIHLLVGSVFLGFSLLVEHYMGNKKYKPLVIISAILFVADLLLIIQVERKTAMMAEMIGYERPTDVYFYLTLIMFGFVSCFILGVLLNLMSRYFNGFKMRILKRKMEKANLRHKYLIAQIAKAKASLDELRKLSKHNIMQWFVEGINEHLTSRYFPPVSLSIEGNGNGSAKDLEK